MQKPKNIQELIDTLNTDEIDYEHMSLDEIKKRDFVLRSVLIGIRDNLLSLEGHLRELIINE